MYKSYFLIIILSIVFTSITAQKTNWTEAHLKDHWQKNGISEFEGLYELTYYPFYKYAVLKENGKFYIIFISRSNPESYNNYWKEGDIKAYLTQTGNKISFFADWYFYNKKRTQKYVVEIYDGSMKVKGNMGTDIYLRTFPLYDNNTNLKSGSGFALTQSGLIVTNFHLVDESKSVIIRGVNADFSVAYNAKIIVLDKVNDLAILQIEDSKFTSLGKIPYSLNMNLAKVGENVFVLGYPLTSTMGEEIKLTNGLISSRTGFQGDITTYQFSAPVQPGNSGGPLFNSDGSIIGIVNAKHLLTEGVSYAVKSSYISNLIDLLPIPIDLPTNNSLNSKPLPQQVEEIKSFVYIIESK